MTYGLLGDIVAGVHAAWVLAVVLGLVLFLVGAARGWKWVGNRWVRGIHLAMIALVISRATIWDECPLTTWERDLRAMSVPGTDQASALGQFFHDIIHPPLPIGVFLPLYSFFGLLVVASLWLVPVRWSPERDSDASDDADPVPGRISV